MAMKSINPATREVIAETPELTPVELEQKLALAQSAFESWRTTSFAERSRLMKAAAQYMRDNKDKLAAVITQEVGKTLAASKGEVEKSATACDYYADNAEDFLSPEVIPTDASNSYVRFDPIGVVLAVMPWNFPFWQVFRFAAPALMAGNVGVLKHASNVQLSGKAIEEIFSAAGFPEGAFLNLAIGSAKVESVIRDDRVRAVTLTGSEKAGSSVAKTSGEEIKKTVLELGGSDAFIILPDADLAAAAKTAVLGRLQANAGQSCIAAKRFIVHSSIADTFTKNVVAEIEALKLGDPADPTTDVGPLANEQMLTDIGRQVEESVAKGAKVVTGGKPGSDTGYFFQPTVMTGVTAGMPAYEEEVFGPVIPIITYETEEEAVAIANSNIYGLGSTIFTSDIAKAEKIAPLIEAGSVFINHQVRSDPRLPFGGVKKSGYGRELSHYGIKEFVNIKTVWVK